MSKPQKGWGFKVFFFFQKGGAYNWNKKKRFKTKYILHLLIFN